MSELVSAWISLWRWRWWRDAGGEIARRAVLDRVAHGVRNEVLACDDRLRASSLLQQRMRAIERAARWMPGSRCLDRALGLAEWSDRQGIPVELCIGVRRASGSVRAHAWVEFGAEILDPDPAATAQFLRLEGDVSGVRFDR